LNADDADNTDYHRFLFALSVKIRVIRVICVLFKLFFAK